MAPGSPLAACDTKRSSLPGLRMSRPVRSGGFVGLCVSCPWGDTASPKMSEETPPQPNVTASDSTEPELPADGSDLDRSAAAPAGEEGPPKKRRRRRRKKKKPADGVAADVSPASERASSDGGGQSPAAAPDAMAASLANLAGGLFSHLDAREIPCRLEGCRRTWVWTAEDQIQAFGQPPPRRLCNQHAQQLDSVADVAAPCANPGCEKTWTWTKSARSAHLQRGGTDHAPKRICDDCQAEEKALVDREATCRVDGCKRTWIWDADAQLKHRTWLRRSAEEGESDRGPRGKGRKRQRRRKRTRGSIHEAPPRMCELCRQKHAQLEGREGPCKVHGCTRMAKVDRDTQLRAWAALQTDDLTAEPTALPRRMCEVCREFCKNHPDRAVACGRPGCDQTWAFKTGAQLQAFLAGRLEDPLRLCEECSKGDFMVLERPEGAPAGAEVMPCLVLGCEGLWYWLPGTQLEPCAPGELSPHRMCAKHRAEHLGEPAPDATVDAPSSDAAPEGDAAPDGDAAPEDTVQASVQAPVDSPQSAPEEDDAAPSAEASPTEPAEPEPRA